MTVHETESKKNNIGGLFSVVPDHDMVFFSIPYYPSGFRAYHERELYCVPNYAYSFYVFGAGLVRIPLPGRRTSRMSFYV